ncbi:MAG: hydroxyacid dehydrogenase, partial [Propionicimonas sp.]
LKPAPQRRDRIFTASALARLHERFTVVDLENDPSDEEWHGALPEAIAVIGQPDLDAETLAHAPKLRGIFNVEGNFFPNVDYQEAFARGIRVLGCGPAYSQAVAEYSLGLALDLARGISREDRAARVGKEKYVSEGNVGSVLLRHSNVGIIGFGNLGRALRPMLTPFSPRIRVYDPWIPATVLVEADVEPTDLDDLLRRSRFVFMFATVTSDNEHLLNARRLALLPDGARLVLVSRAAVVDYAALLPELASGRLYAGIDVWPVEPLPADDPFRSVENVVISGHRAGGITAAFQSIGDMVLDDLELLAAGLPPVRMQVAAPELVTRYRNRPVT